jgi:hypothetical protein
MTTIARTLSLARRQLGAATAPLAEAAALALADVPDRSADLAVRVTKE